MAYGSSGTGGIPAASLTTPLAPQAAITPAVSVGAGAQTAGIFADGVNSRTALARDVVQVVCSILEMAMADSGLGTGALGGASDLASVNGTAPAAGQGLAADGTVLANTDPTRTTIVQIDNFVADNTGFNHGQEVGNAILANSPNPANVDLIQLESGNNPATLSANIANNLQEVLTRMDQGQDYDAINISQTTDPNDPNNARIHDLINEFARRGVAVNIAAGNHGAGVTNGLNTDGAFVVQNTQGGQVAAESGLGNVSAEGRTTSFATAAFTGQAAAAVNGGANLSQIGNGGVATADAGLLATTGFSSVGLPTGLSASAVSPQDRLAIESTADNQATTLIQNALGLPQTASTANPLLGGTTAATAPTPQADMASMMMTILKSIVQILTQLF